MSENSPPDDSPTLAARARVPQHVVYRSFATETVALNLKTGKYHGLNPTAGHMLEVLERSETIGAAANALADEYGHPLAEMERDIAALCARLAARDLIELDSGAGN